MDGVWLTGIQVAEGSGELSLAGRATRAELVPVYLERLRAEEALRGQTFSRLEVTRAAPPSGMALVEFALSGGEDMPAKETPEKEAPGK